ncbi:hypothetical protein GLOTRDRAFT_120457 [Gloeophyllum trabeum ATCC 11539]|uniref:ARM repeat-containing protein n=1 Tax=Gloeophyllum trabeum (strain ATCC 11539 / FP-39264 / Madison 617) TaxID=670483 RepID=S7QCL7_GLOTA|nr:uncharacterized protein GLOTRDRAFT_120457 [Gloeophyllum trabeum ATCC 11539]EPQ57138.1 hypothetical protein GLOTRDRAFT_120457 [Gloeophyllum trabeum ATCC 11539]
MNKNQYEQEKEIRELLRRADRHADRTGNLRRETLRRLIELAHSPSPALKSLVASNIKYYIKDFPDLEDDAINAVYDLCEDPISKIRIEGYHAIVQVSREQRKFIKRNADVLVQLLQSDEPAEVVVVKKALLEHIDMDPRVTLGVLCDQVVPHEEPMDEEEQAIRERLRSLVLAFLTGEAKRSIIERHAADPECERVLVEGLSPAISRLSFPDVDLIVRNILLALPSYRSYSSSGDKLIQSILARARSILAQELRPSGGLLSLPSTRQYLNLAAFVSLERHAAQPLHLVRFYCTTLLNRMALSRLESGVQTAIIHDFAEALEASTSDNARPKNPVSEEILSVRNQAVDASVILFERLAESGLREKTWDDCRKLIRAVSQRKQENDWSPPIPVVAAMRKIQALARSEDHAQDIQDLIRSLLSTPKPPLTQSASDTNIVEGKTNKVSGPVILKRKIEHRDEGVPPRPASVVPSVPSQNGGPSNRATDVTRKTVPTARGDARSSNASWDIPPHANKRARTDSGSKTPSLLSRLSTAPSHPGAEHGLPPKPELQIRGRGSQVRPRSPQPDKSLSGGLSIKGAARAATRNSGEGPPPSRTSLLDRLSAGGNDSLAERIEGDVGNRKQKRGRGV